MSSSELRTERMSTGTDDQGQPREHHAAFLVGQTEIEEHDVGLLPEHHLQAPARRWQPRAPCSPASPG